MCPDPQLLSIYMDDELPSPWKEKMEAHLVKCPVCKGNYENFKKLQEYFKKDTHQSRTIVELAERSQPETFDLEHENMEKAKEKIWRNLENKRRFYRNNMWRRRLSIPLPAAAAAAIILVLFAAVMLRGNPFNNNNINNSYANLFIAAEEEIPVLMPVADMNGVLQYLGSNDSNIILQLPESQNFLRAGEPSIIRAADYSGRRP